MRKLLVVLLLCAPIKGFAGEFVHSIGIGLQYGFVGYQLAYAADKNRFHGSAGFPAAFSLGYQRAIGLHNRHTVGMNVATMPVLADFAGVTYNYYVNGYADSGFVFGVEVGQTRLAEDGIVSAMLRSTIGGLSGTDPNEVELEDLRAPYYLINLAYQF